MTRPARTAAIASIKREVRTIAPLLDVIGNEAVAETVAFVLRVLALAVRRLDHIGRPRPVLGGEIPSVSSLRWRLYPADIRCRNPRLQHRDLHHAPMKMPSPAGSGRAQFRMNRLLLTCGAACQARADRQVLANQGEVGPCHAPWMRDRRSPWPAPNRRPRCPR